MGAISVEDGVDTLASAAGNDVTFSVDTGASGGICTGS